MWEDLYPFESKWFKTPYGHQMHYLDTDSGQPVVLLHGNPTWSFMYRRLIQDLMTKGRRAIAPDHIGCGLSDKPQDWTYTLSKHSRNLEALLNDHLDLPSFDLVVSDWGAPIGFHYAVQNPERIRRIVVMNSTIWPSRHFPKSIYLTRMPFIGALIVRSWNLLLRKAIHHAAASHLTRDVRRGFRAPYQSFENRIALQRFPQDIPLKPTHPSFQAFQFIDQNLPVLQSKPLMLAWGQLDFCFPESFLRNWQEHFPQAKTVVYPSAAHFLLEDSDQAIADICHFLTVSDSELADFPKPPPLQAASENPSDASSETHP